MATHTLPAGTLATALAVAASNYTGFDPIDLFEDTMSLQPMLHSKVMESMCWMIDQSCINQARTILFERYKEADHTGADSFADFCQLVAEDIDHQSLYDEEGNEAALATMLSLRNYWHDTAAACFAANDQDYKSKSLREHMEAEKVKAADVGTRTNYRKLAELEAAGDTAKAERLYSSYMQANALASQQRVDSNKALMPVTLEILRTANRYAAVSLKFSDLPTTKQKQLVSFAVGVIERARVDVAARMSKQPIAFGHVAEAAYQATFKLNDVLKQKYSDAGELESCSQVQLEMNRSAKRRACCSID